MDKLPELTEQEEREFKEGQRRYEAWYDKTPEPQNDIKQLPDWFNLENYEGVVKLSPRELLKLLALRKVLEPIIEDGPQIPIDHPAHQFIQHLFENPLSPDYDIYPAAKEDVEYLLKKSEIGKVLDLSTDQDYLFKIDKHLPRQMQIKAFGRKLDKLQAAHQTTVFRHRKVDFTLLAELNILAVIDLNLWWRTQSQEPTWGLIWAVCDPMTSRDKTVVEKHVKNFIFNLFDHPSGFIFLTGQIEESY